MSELRHDPIRKNWVIVAPERERRVFRTPPVEKTSAFCPFCLGNEDKTPHPIRVIPESGHADPARSWRVRVLPNPYAALGVEGRLNRSAAGVYDRIEGVGAHEIVVETPDHDHDLPDLPLEHLAQVLGVYRERLDDLMRDVRLRYVQIFRNHGPLGPATVSHPHSQIIATPVTPNAIATELRSARDHFHVKERCLYCDVMTQELAEGARLVSVNEHFMAFCPYASRSPFEVHVMPRRHAHDFRGAGPELLRHLAAMLSDVLGRLRVALDNPPYNLLLHTAPNMHSGASRAGYWETLAEDFHWHIEIYPHPPQMAGFEMGTGISINPTAPEAAARFLREVAVNGAD